MSHGSFTIGSNRGSFSNMFEIGARLLPKQKLSDEILGLHTTCRQRTQTSVRTSNVPRNILLDRAPEYCASVGSANSTCRVTVYSKSGIICQHPHRFSSGNMEDTTVPLPKLFLSIFHRWIGSSLPFHSVVMISLLSRCG